MNYPYYFILHRRKVIGIVIVLTVIFGLAIPRIKQQTGPKTMMPESSTAFTYKEKIENIFCNSQRVIMSVSDRRGNSVYSVEMINGVRALTDLLRRAPFVKENEITSLTITEDMTASSGALTITRLVPEDAELSEAFFEQVRQNVRDNPLLAGRLVSTNEKFTLVAAAVPEDGEGRYTMPIYRYLMAEIPKIEAMHPHLRIDLTGQPVIYGEILGYMLRDIVLLFPLSVVIVFLMLYVILKQIRGMLCPVLVCLICIIWTFGLKAILGSPVTMTETIIPVMLTAIACADGIHIASEFLSFLRRGLSVSDALEKTMRILRRPIILTSITTAVGFGSLITAPGISIRNLGIFTAFGVMVALFLSLIFIPAMLSYTAEPEHASESGTEGNPSAPGGWHGRMHIAAEQFFFSLGHFIKKLRWVGVCAAICILAAGIYGINSLAVDSDPVNFFPETSRIYRATQSIGKSMGGVANLVMVIAEKGSSDLEADPPGMTKNIRTTETGGTAGTVSDSDSASADVDDLLADFGAAPEASPVDEYRQIMKEPETLQFINSLQEYAETIPEVTYTASLSDYVRRINHLLSDRDPSYNRIPYRKEAMEGTEADGQKIIAQLLLLYENAGGDAISPYVKQASDADSYRTGRVEFFLKSVGDIGPVISVLKERLEEVIPSDLSYRFTGDYVMLLILDYIIRSQVFSLIASLIGICLTLSIIYRSVRTGLLLTIPVSTAVLANFFIMSITGITLNAATAIIASIGMGVGVDYSIHFYSRFCKIKNEVSDLVEVISRTLSESGTAITANALTVGLAFLALSISRYSSIQHIALILSVSMITTAAASLLLLPAILFVNIPEKHQKKIK